MNMSLKKGIEDYQLYIFDMDGTLYFQRPLQLYMGISMVLGCLRPGGVRELRLVLEFRRQREAWTEKNEADLDQAQYRRLAQRWKTTPETVEAAVQKWIYEKPLGALYRFRDGQLAQWMRELHRQGKRVVIYSDYPAQQKQKALQLPEVPCFYGGQKEIGAMKPDPKGIQVIMEAMGETQAERVLVIGDRMSRDGEAAKNAGADFLIVRKYRFRRRRQLKALFAK